MQASFMAMNNFHNLDNLELSLGEFCDLIQTDEADVLAFADPDGTSWTETAGTKPQPGPSNWGSAPKACALGDQSAALMKNQSSSSFLSDSEMFVKHEQGWNKAHQGSTGLPDLQTKRPDSCEHSPPGSGTPTLLSAASAQMQQHLSSSDLQAALHPAQQCQNSPSNMADDEFDAISKPPASHSSVEKQRRDKLNSLIEKLASIVPPSDERFVTSGPGARRPKHVVLSDAIRTISSLRDHMRTCPGLAPAPGSSAPTPATAKSGSTSSGFSIAMDMPLAVDIPATSTGVMVEAPQGSAVWRLRVTCRDRPGLLGDVAVALRSLPVNISAASVTTSTEGKAQQVFELSVLDLSLAPEEVQCAVNAALYAHLVPSAAAAITQPQPAAKRLRCV